MLSLIYGITHPERTRALILRGIFMCRKSELQWFYQVTRTIWDITERVQGAWKWTCCPFRRLWKADDGQPTNWHLCLICKKGCPIFCLFKTSCRKNVKKLLYLNPTAFICCTSHWIHPIVRLIFENTHVSKHDEAFIQKILTIGISEREKSGSGDCLKGTILF